VIEVLGFLSFRCDDSLFAAHKVDEQCTRWTLRLCHLLFFLTLVIIAYINISWSCSMRLQL